MILVLLGVFAPSGNHYNLAPAELNLRSDILLDGLCQNSSNWRFQRDMMSCSVGVVENHEWISQFLKDPAFLSSGLEVQSFDTVESLARSMAENLTLTSIKPSNIFLGIYGDSDGVVTFVGPPVNSIIDQFNYAVPAIALVTGFQQFVLSIPQTVFGFMARQAETATLGATPHRFLWPAYYSFMFYFVLVATLINLITEKSKRLQSLLLISGVSHLKYFVHWFITQLTTGLIGIILLLIITFASGSIKVVSFIQIASFFVCFLLACISLGFFGSIFLFDARVASAVSALYQILSEGCVFLVVLVIQPAITNVAGLRVLGTFFLLLSFFLLVLLLLLLSLSNEHHISWASIWNCNVQYGRI